MNRPEATHLLAYLDAANLLKIVEGQAAVWADVLEDVRIEDAREAARQIAKRRTSNERWLTPGDIRAQVREIRRARLHSLPPKIQNPELPEAALTVFSRFNQIYQAGLMDGTPPQQAWEAACKHSDIPVTALLGAA